MSENNIHNKLKSLVDWILQQNSSSIDRESKKKMIEDLVNVLSLWGSMNFGSKYRKYHILYKFCCIILSTYETIVLSRDATAKGIVKMSEDGSAIFYEKEGHLCVDFCGVRQFTWDQFTNILHAIRDDDLSRMCYRF